jgi:hypothetical protein
MKMLRFALAFACLALPGMAAAQVIHSVRVDLTREPGSKSNKTHQPGWNAGQDERLVSQAYRPLLRFAECASQFDRAVATRVLSSPLKSLQSEDALKSIARASRGCIVEHASVHPVLLRAAFAETRLKGSDRLVLPPGQAAVGLPAVVDGYPLRRIAECQVRRAPGLVRDLLATQPGDRAEHQAASTLFAATPGCGTARLGRLTATAARLALIEAEYVRRFVAAR